jgi:hypothetical protein
MLMIENPEERPLGRYQHGWKDNIKMDVREIDLSS